MHLHTDSFYVWIRTGFVTPYLPEAEEQNRTVTAVTTGLYGAFTRLGGLGEHVIDSSAQTAEQTAAELAAALGAGRLVLADEAWCAPPLAARRPRRLNSR